jgi:hypothetical protein
MVRIMGIEERIQKVLKEPRIFGRERSAHQIWLKEVVVDRKVLTQGHQLIRDELDFDTKYGADFTFPSIITTLANTICGDKICDGQPSRDYNSDVASRFANMSEIGEYQVERFKPAGGGTDDGSTLAHVTISHAADFPIIERLVNGNPESFLLYNFDLQSHVGKIAHDGTFNFGSTCESPYRLQRAACGAINGVIAHFDPGNADHKRLRADIGEHNYDILRNQGIFTDNKTELSQDISQGHDIRYVVAAAIVAVQGMYNTMEGILKELNHPGILEHGVAHLTASININRTSEDDTVLKLARAIVHNGNAYIQGFGTDASKYGGCMMFHKGEQRLKMVYDGLHDSVFPVLTLGEHKAQ